MVAEIEFLEVLASRVKQGRPIYLQGRGDLSILQMLEALSSSTQRPVRIIQHVSLERFSHA